MDDICHTSLSSGHHEGVDDNKKKIESIEEFNACLSALPRRSLRSHYLLHTLKIDALNRSYRYIRCCKGLNGESNNIRVTQVTRQLLTKRTATLFQIICEFSTIEVLDLSDFFMGPVPFSICRLYNLKKLYIRYNLLSSLPHSLRRCQKLETIDMRNNLFSSLPYCLTFLPNLSSLSYRLSHCCFIKDLEGQPDISDRLTKFGDFAYECYEPLSLFQLSVPPSLNYTEYGKLDAFTVLPTCAPFVADVETAMALFFTCDVCSKSCPRQRGINFYYIRMLCMRFAGNDLVPFDADVCSHECAVVANDKYHTMPTGFIFPDSWDGWQHYEYTLGGYLNR